MIWNNFFFYPYYPFFENDMPLDKPPTMFSILDDILNYGKNKRVKIKDFASEGREYVFDFDYPTSEYLDKAYFEETFIDNFMMRRIGTETFTAFQILLRAKLKTIMPYYNVMFDALGEKLDLYNLGSYTEIYDGDTTRVHTGTETVSAHEVNKSKNTEKGKTTTEDERREEKKGENNETKNGTVNNQSVAENTWDATTDDRFSDTPQNHLENIRNGEYVTEYRYNVAEGSNTGETTQDETTHGTTETDYAEKKHNRADINVNDEKDKTGLNTSDKKLYT